MGFAENGFGADDEGFGFAAKGFGAKGEAEAFCEAGGQPLPPKEDIVFTEGDGHLSRLVGSSERSRSLESGSHRRCDEMSDGSASWSCSKCKRKRPVEGMIVLFGDEVPVGDTELCALTRFW